jgi:hypothetical protein
MTATIQAKPEISSRCEQLIEEARGFCKQIDKSKRAIIENAWRAGRVLMQIYKCCPPEKIAEARKRIGISRTTDFYHRTVARLEWHELANWPSRSAILRHFEVKFTGHRIKKMDALNPREAGLAAMEYVRRSTDPARAAAMLIQQATRFLANGYEEAA